jgi:hypothetical protein
MTCGRRPQLVILAILAGAFSGCMYLRPAVAPHPWDNYGNAGPLRVHGAPRATAGQVVFRALKRQPRLAAFLADQGEPDTLEVVGARWAPKRIILTYRRRGAGGPRRIVLEPTSEGYIARAPEPLTVPRSRAAAAAKPPAAARSTKARPSRCPECPAPVEPTVSQKLECPIDPVRDDCRALCVAGGVHEWCRSFP